MLGFACQIGFSPNGRFICSGDGEGKLFFWDWKSCKMYRKLTAQQWSMHWGAVAPFRASKIVTCGWDGLITGISSFEDRH